MRVFGVGNTGINVVDLLVAGGFDREQCVALNAGGTTLDNSAAAWRLQLEVSRLQGLGSGGDPDRGRLAAEEKEQDLKNLCQGNDLVLIVAGLGGGSGTGISPVLARIAKASGALVLAFVTTPFECEGSRRLNVAQEGLDALRETVDGVVCLPNQKVLKLIELNTTVVDTFKAANGLLADVVSGLWRLMSFKGLLEIPPEDLFHLLRDRHSESAFAVAEFAGAERARMVLEKLLAHPLLEEGRMLAEADAILVSITGGPDLTMAEVNQVTEQITAGCGSVPLLTGACIDERFAQRLAVTIIATRKLEAAPPPRASVEGLDTQLLARNDSDKPNSRFLPPAPVLPPDKLQKLLSRQGGTRRRKGSAKMRQTQLPLEIISKGRFDKSEPTIYKGEDLDVPTYIRRGVPLN